MDLQDICNEGLGHDWVHALAARFGEDLIWDCVVYSSIGHHPVSEHQFFSPIEVRLERADGSEFVNKVVAADLFQ